MRESRKFRQRGPENFLAMNVFHRGTHVRNSSRSNWTPRVQLLFEEARTTISKETYSNLLFSRGGPNPDPSLDPPMINRFSCDDTH